jgi:hypothetical protein
MPNGSSARSAPDRPRIGQDGRVRKDADGPDGREPVYDRDFVLFGPYRERVLELWQVERYGAEAFGHSDAISLYGMRPADWHARGIRLMGRTAVECTRDDLAQVIATDVARLAAEAPTPAAPLVVDPFGGSANTLYWLQRMIPGSTGVGFEIDPVIGEHTAHNLAVVGAPLSLVGVDYAQGMASIKPKPGQLVVVYVAPPWGHAFDGRTLDLAHTEPPAGDIVDVVTKALPDSPLLVAVQAFENLDHDALADVESRFDWTHLHTYALNPPGRNPALVLGTRGWEPAANPFD